MKGKDFKIRKAEKVYLLVHNKKSEDKASAYADEIVRKLKAAKIKTEKVPCDWYSIDEITKILSQQERIYAITMGEEGALIIKASETYRIEAQKIENLVDTTGAGDLFAAGFLEHFIKNESLENCGSRGVEMASKVIQQYGARL